MGIVDGGGWADGRDGVFELMIFNLEFFDPMFSGQGAGAPSFPTVVDFLASIF
jgi:hypothetical protein